MASGWTKYDKERPKVEVGRTVQGQSIASGRTRYGKEEPIVASCEVRRGRVSCQYVAWMKTANLLNRQKEP